MKNIKVSIERLKIFSCYLLSDEYEEILYMIEPSCYDCADLKSVIENMACIEEAISECLNVFPQDWIWDEDNEYAYFKDDINKDPANSAKLYFGLNEESFKHLFVPYNQKPEIYGGNVLDILVTSRIIGKNIEAFIHTYEKSNNLLCLK
jgi:hypothetical protein